MIYIKIHENLRIIMFKIDFLQNEVVKIFFDYRIMFKYLSQILLDENKYYDYNELFIDYLKIIEINDPDFYETHHFYNLYKYVLKLKAIETIKDFNNNFDNVKMLENCKIIENDSNHTLKR